MEKSFEEICEDNRLYGHLRSTNLHNKKDYLNDLYNISDSFIGQIDIMFLNAFIQECESLIINAITLFEKGHFDCSCYSLRQALEVSDCMVYFSELNDIDREKEFAKWNLAEKLEAREIGNFLNTYAENYKEIKVAFLHYFKKKKRTKARLNTIVHKQGLDTFYSFRRRFTDTQSAKEASMFNSFLKTVITSISILRLTVDPFPALLMDEEVYYRIPDLMTEAYSNDFVHKYIGAKCINEYKKTNLYSGFYNGIVDSREKLNPSTANLAAHQFIDIDKLDELTEQSHLLGAYDLLALIIACLSPNITSLYMNDGFIWYRTSAIRVQRLNYSSLTIQSFKKDCNYFNEKFENAYMSFLMPHNMNFHTFGNEDFSIFIEHNLPFTKLEIALIEDKYLAETNNLRCSSEQF